VAYSCLISWSSRVPQGPCCTDDDDHYNEQEDDDASASTASSKLFGSGCAVGYTCAAPIPTSFVQELQSISSKEDEKLASGPHCQLDESVHPSDSRGRPIENDYERMPRYQTCPAFAKEDIAMPYGLPIPLAAAAYNKSNNSSERSAKLNEDMDANTDMDQHDGYMGKLAYFSNMGSLSTSSDLPSSTPSQHADVTTAVIGIHGSGRDAGSYLCAMIAAVADIASSLEIDERLQDLGRMEKEFHLDSSSIASTLRGRRRVQDGVEDNMTTKTTTEASTNNLAKKEEILVVAPWFLSPADGQPVSSSSSHLPFLQWVDRSPIAHTFRYGAESIGVSIDNDENSENDGKTKSTTISSYGAMDVLLETLCNKENYPNLERIVIAGHSAGGQFVHRWGLSSDSWCFGDGERNNHPVVGDDSESNVDLPSIRVVAANPRSYAYLDERRYLPATTDDVPLVEDEGGEGSTLSPFNELEFRSPTSSELNDCQEYNQYCWGLEDNPNVPAPYITNNVNKLMTSDDNVHDNTDLFCRYASRDILYLSGERDTKQLGNQICDEDGYQGPSRRERSERFYASLQVRGDEILSSTRRRDVLLEEEGNEEVVAEMSRAKGGFCARHKSHFEDERMQVHKRILVNNVGHDHALIFQSAEGRAGMLSDPKF